MKLFNYELDYSRIKELRLENNFSQKYIAEYLNINQSTYSKFELKKAFITIEMLNQLSNLYRVPLDYLLKLNNDKTYFVKVDYLDKKIVGQNLRAIRKKYKLYQDTLAKEIGTGHSLISEYESGKRLISLTYAYAICKKYNVSMDYLYGKINKKDASL